MVSMAKNAYTEIGDELKREMAQSPSAQSVYRQNEASMMRGGQAGTDGEIAAVVLEGLMQSGGDPAAMASAMGMLDFSPEEVAGMEADLSKATPEEQAMLIDGYMGYASPGPEAILEVLSAGGSDAPDPREGMRPTQENPDGR